jgi:hypothetical protein
VIPTTGYLQIGVSFFVGIWGSLTIEFGRAPAISYRCSTKGVTRLPVWLAELIERIKRIAPPLALLSILATSTIAFLPDHKVLVYVVVVFVVLILLAIVFSYEIEWLTRRTRCLARFGAPYVALGILLLVVQMRSAVRKIEMKLADPYPPMQIDIKDPPLSGIFNATYDYQVRKNKGLPPVAREQPSPGYTHAFTVDDQGNAWVVIGGGASDKQASFGYDRHESGLQADWASSGGYVSFPKAPVDRLAYRYLTFDCKVTGSLGQPDIGLRLVVDDQRPSIPEENKEAEVYELKSLNIQPESKPLSGNWQKFEVDTRSFEESGAIRSLSKDGVDPNRINKIVFFVNDGMTRKSAKGTVWVRYVVFSTSK